MRKKKLYIGLILTVFFISCIITVQIIYSGRYMLIAVDHGYYNILYILLKTGADINTRNRWGQTALHRAPSCITGWNNHKGVKIEVSALMAELLLSHGADVNAKNNRSYTPLHFAAMHDNDLVADILIINGAEINAQGKKGLTPLHLAVAGNSFDVAKILLEHGANVNVQDDVGLSPLFDAVIPDDIKMTALLLKYSALVDIKDEKGESPLDCTDNKIIIDMLKKSAHK